MQNSQFKNTVMEQVVLATIYPPDALWNSFVLNSFWKAYSEAVDPH